MTQGTLYANAFSNLAYKSVTAYNENVEKAKNEASEKIHNLHVFFFIAYAEFIDAADMLDDAKINGEYLKRYRKMAEKLCGDYMRKMKGMYDKNAYNLLFDFSNSTHQNLKNDIHIFYMSLYDVLLNTNVKRKELIAQMQVAISLTQLAIDMYDAFFKKYNKLVGYDISVGYRWMRIDKILLNLKRIMEELAKREDDDSQSIDFGESEQCQLAYRVILNKFAVGEMMNDAAKNALEINNMSNLLE